MFPTDINHVSIQMFTKQRSVFIKIFCVFCLQEKCLKIKHFISMQICEKMSELKAKCLLKKVLRLKVVYKKKFDCTLKKKLK